MRRAPWLALILTGLAIPSAAEPARVGLATRLDGLSDAWLEVLSPLLGATLTTGAVESSASYRVDILSGATPSLVADAVSSATLFDELRHEAHVGARYDLGQDDNLAFGYATSLESDYETHAVSLSGQLALFDRRATLGLSLDLSFETLGHAGDPTLAEPTFAQTLGLVWTHLIGPSTALTAQLSLMHEACSERFGCDANPYRYVGVFERGGAALLFALPERHPDELAQGAAALRLTQALGRRLALHAGYRAYADTWGVLGHTLELTLAATFDERLTLRLDARGALQGAADFFSRHLAAAPEAPEAPSFRTGDPALGGVESVGLGLSADLELGDLVGLRGLAIGANLARYEARYPGSATRPSRGSWSFGGGLRVAF